MTWDKTFNLLTKDLIPMQASVYKIIYEITCDMEYTFLPTIPYDETVLRALTVTHPKGKTLTRNFGQNEEKQTKKEYDAALDELIEKEGMEVKDTIDELCAKRFCELLHN